MPTGFWAIHGRPYPSHGHQFGWIRRGDWQGRNAAKPLQGRSERHALFSKPASLGRPLMVSDHPFEFDYFIVQHERFTFICRAKGKRIACYPSSSPASAPEDSVLYDVDACFGFALFSQSVPSASRQDIVDSMTFLSTFDRGMELSLQRILPFAALRLNRRSGAESLCAGTNAMGEAWE